MAGRAAGNLASNAIQRLKLNGKGKKKRRVDMVVGSTIKYLIYILALILALNQIGVALNFLNQILTILLVIVAVGLFLSIKDFVPNAVAGAYIIYKKRLKVGQTIKVKDVEGKIKKIDLIDTHIRTKNGHDIMIPNSFFVKNLVVKKK